MAEISVIAIFTLFSAFMIVWVYRIRKVLLYAQSERVLAAQDKHPRWVKFMKMTTVPLMFIFFVNLLGGIAELIRLALF